MKYSRNAAIIVTTRKVYNILGRNYVRKCDAIRALAKNQLIWENFEFDEEEQRFIRGLDGKLEAPFYLMQKLVAPDESVEFKSEEDYEAAKKFDRSYISFNYDKWGKMKKERYEKLKAEYQESQPQQSKE